MFCACYLAAESDLPPRRFGDLCIFAGSQRVGCARLDRHSIVVVTSDEVAPASRGQARVVAEFRARGGEVGGYHAGMRLLLLTTTGARTGQRRAVPFTYLPDGGRYVVTAGNAGAIRHPAWYYNLAANRGVTVEAGYETFEAGAVIAEEAERAASYECFAAAYPQLAGYQERTARQIPLVTLTRR
jgi:deazaflavin-dependent oxidoreductase (nitroreductase family)